jgi:hypothetical protein
MHARGRTTNAPQMHARAMSHLAEHNDGHAATQQLHKQQSRLPMRALPVPLALWQEARRMRPASGGWASGTCVLLLIVHAVGPEPNVRRGCAARDTAAHTSGPVPYRRQCPWPPRSGPRQRARARRETASAPARLRARARASMSSAARPAAVRARARAVPPTGGGFHTPRRVAPCAEPSSSCGEPYARTRRSKPHRQHGGDVVQRRARERGGELARVADRRRAHDETRPRTETGADSKRRHSRSAARDARARAWDVPEQPPQDERHVAAEAAAVGVRLVEHHELEPPQQLAHLRRSERDRSGRAKRDIVQRANLRLAVAGQQRDVQHVRVGQHNVVVGEPPGALVVRSVPVHRCAREPLDGLLGIVCRATDRASYTCKLARFASPRGAAHPAARPAACSAREADLARAPWWGICTARDRRAWGEDRRPEPPECVKAHAAPLRPQVSYLLLPARYGFLRPRRALQQRLHNCTGFRQEVGSETVLTRAPAAL